jgi:hypothetical protein
MQIKADWGRNAPNPVRHTCTNHVLGNGCDNVRAVDRKGTESRVLIGFASAWWRQRSPPARKLIGINPWAYKSR